MSWWEKERWATHRIIVPGYSLIRVLLSLLSWSEIILYRGRETSRLKPTWWSLPKSIGEKLLHTLVLLVVCRKLIVHCSIHARRTTHSALHNASNRLIWRGYYYLGLPENRILLVFCLASRNLLLLYMGVHIRRKCRLGSLLLYRILLLNWDPTSVVANALHHELLTAILHLELLTSLRERVELVLIDEDLLPVRELSRQINESCSLAGCGWVGRWGWLIYLLHRFNSKVFFTS